MGLMNCASSASLWRGYEYYTGGRVRVFKEIDGMRFDGLVSGSGEAVYDVHIDTEHPRSSHCSCPHANGKRIICKHMIAVYFTAFPDEAVRYKKEVDDYERQRQKYYDELEDNIIRCVKKLSKSELQEELLEILLCDDGWILDRFVREHID